MISNHKKQSDKSANSLGKKHQGDINPKEDFHTESGEKKNALKGNKKGLMGMDSPDDAEELGNG